MPWHLAVYDWLVRAASESLLLLVFGSLAVILIRQPARRARLITWTLGSCLVVPWLGLLPGWPRWEVGVTEEQAESAERGVRNAERAEAAEVRKKGRGEAARNEDDEHPTATNEVGPTEIAEAEARSVELPALAAPRSQLAPRWETWPRWVASAYVAGVGLM
ncbi:MAG TPA: hypothetical protein VGX76_05240, partial [Pirellulales bacterium]|nr:hypothetical protein [Pirellulales bacterium]